MTQLLATKLFAPSPHPNQVSRPRLLDQLKLGSASKLVLISAPAGYGKTTLLSEWIQQSECPTAWLSLDKQDNDLRRFLSYVIASLGSIQVEVDEQVLDVYKSPQSDHFTTVLIPLINRISASDRRFYLVLDDYHLIENQEIHEAFTYLLNNLPPKMGLLITSRVDPPLRLAQLRARGELCEIRAADLRFSVEEAIDFLNQRMGLDLAPSDVSTLTDKTEGWIAGLQLAALSLQNHPDKHSSVTTFAGDDRYIADYLLDEVLGRQPSPVQTFLLQTSILERLSAPLCDAVTGQSDSQVILIELERANLFLEPLDNQRKWYRYHHLFRDLLGQRLEQLTPADQIANLHRQASDWFRSGNLIFEAINHAFEADDMLRIVRLIEANIFTMLDRGGILTLMRWLDAIPGEVRRKHPWLSVAHAWVLVYAGNLDAGESTLQIAENALHILEEDEQTRARGYICAIQAYAFWMRGQGEPGATLARQALTLLPEDELSVRAFAANTLGGTLLQCNEVDQAIKSLQDSITWARASGNAHIYCLAAGSLSYNWIQKGRIRQAERVCREAFAHLEGEQIRESPAIAQIYAQMTNILILRNDLDHALQFAQKGLEISKQWDQIDTLTVSYIYLANVLIARGEFESAESALSQARKLGLHESPWFKTIIEESQAQMHLASGNLTAASRWAAESGIDYRDEVPQPERNTYRTLAEVLMVEGKLSEATHLLESLIKDSENAGANGNLLSLLPLQSVVQLDLGNQEGALDILTRALIMAEPEGYARTYISLGEPMARLLRLAIQHDIQPPFCAQLLDAIENKQARDQDLRVSRPAKKPVSVNGVYESLSRRELEVLQLIAEGCTNQEIAQELVLSLYTVKSHARNIYSKLGVKNRTEAVARARLLGLLPQD
jgi:LuxR family maltose regulon positive regulatory protein